MESCPFRQLWLDSVHTLRLFVSNTSTNTTHCTLSHNPNWPSSARFLFLTVVHHLKEREKSFGHVAAFLVPFGFCF